MNIIKLGKEFREKWEREYGESDGFLVRVPNFSTLSDTYVPIKSDADIVKLKEDLDKALKDLIKDEERENKLEVAKEKINFLLEKGYEYCLENYHILHSFLMGNLFKQDWHRNLDLNKVRREIGGVGYYSELGDRVEFVNKITKEFLIKYPIFIKYPKYTISILKELFDHLTRGQKEYIISKEPEFGTITNEDLYTLWEELGYDVLITDEVKKYSLRAFIGYVHLRHSNYEAFKLLIKHPYLASKADKDIVTKAFIALSNCKDTEDAKKLSEIIREAEVKKRWEVLLRDRRFIQEVGYRALGESNKEITGRAKEKDEWVKKLNVDIGGYRFRVLGAGDPLHLSIGIETNCCQQLGGAGEGAAIDSLINPLAGVLILEGAGGEVIAQSYFHYVPGVRRGYILDNVEINQEAARGINLEEKYHKLAIWARENLGIDFFECGTGYNKLNNNSFGKSRWVKDPRHFEVEEPYSDWDPGGSLNLFEYKPISRKEKEEEGEKIEPLVKGEYTEGMGRVQGPRFHGKLKGLFPKKERAEEGRKEIRRKQEEILREMGIRNIPYILSFPVVKEITGKIVRKRESGEDYNGDMERLRGYFERKKLARNMEYIISKYSGELESVGEVRDTYEKVSSLVKLFIEANKDV